MLHFPLEKMSYILQFHSQPRPLGLRDIQNGGRRSKEKITRKALQNTSRTPQMVEYFVTWHTWFWSLLKRFPGIKCGIHPAAMTKFKCVTCHFVECFAACSKVLRSGSAILKITKILRTPGLTKPEDLKIPERKGADFIATHSKGTI